MEYRSRVPDGATPRRFGRCFEGRKRRLARPLRDCAHLALLIWALLGLPWPVDAEEPVFIGKVAINTVDVFAPDEVRTFLNRGANALHVVTLDSTVRRLLIFEEGDVYDPAVLAEAERNLRALGLFRSVSITAGEVRDGVVDVQVNTQDAWTVQIGLSAGSGG